MFAVPVWPVDWIVQFMDAPSSGVAATGRASAAEARAAMAARKTRSGVARQDCIGDPFQHQLLDPLPAPVIPRSQIDLCQKFLASETKFNLPQGNPRRWNGSST